MNDITVKSLLLYAHDLAHYSEGWIQPLLPTLEGVDAATAAWRPTTEAKSVWEIVAHLTQYLESVVAALSGQAGPELDDWPDITDTSETAWQTLVGRLRTAGSALGPLLERTTDQEISQPPAGKETPRWERVIDILIHDAYHAGQIYQLLGLRKALGQAPVAATV